MNVFIQRCNDKYGKEGYMNRSFNTWMILSEGNFIVRFYEKHHQNRNFTASITVVSRLL